MIPFANLTATVYHAHRAADASGKTQTTWVRSVYKGCRFDTRTELRNIGGALAVVRVPTVQFPPSATVCVDDIVVRGVCSVDIPTGGVAASVLSGHAFITVGAVADYTSAPLPHIVVTGR